MRRLNLRALIVAFGLMLALPAQAGDAPSGRHLSRFVLPDSNGAQYDVGPHVGRDVVIVAFWATWCKPCKIELKALHTLYLKYRDQGLVVLAVSIDGPDSIAEVANYQRKFGFEFPVLMDAETAVLEQYNPRGDVPFSMVVDRSGAVVETHQGYNPGDEVPLEKHLIEMLAEQPSGTVAAPPESDYWVAPSGFRIEGTQSLQLRWLSDNLNGRDVDDNVFGVVNKLSIAAVSGPLNIGLRRDQVAYPLYDRKGRCAGTDLANCQWSDDHRVEKIWGQYRARKLTLRAGDFYGSMGRGMQFSVRKIDELGLDTTIRGGQAKTTVGPVTIRALGGEANITNVDINDAGKLEEEKDLLAGGEVSVAIPGDVTLAARGMWIDYDDSGALDRGDWSIGGSLEVRNLADIVTVYVEGAFLKNVSTGTIAGVDIDNSFDGSALYGSIQIHPFEGFALLLEGKDYRRFDMSHPGLGIPLVYHEAPTLERFDQIVPTTTNATGGRIKAEYYFKSIALLVAVNGVYYGWSEPGANETVNNFGADAKDVLHTYLELEKRWSNGIYANVGGGWRNEGLNTVQDAGDREFRRRVWHAETDLQFPLAGPHSLGLRWQHRGEQTEKRDDKGDYKDFSRGDLAATWGIATLPGGLGALSLGVLWTYQTEQKDRPQFDNVAAEVLWRFSDWGQFGVFGGRNTGGIICVSGVCRDFPPFTGVRGEFVARF